jgi:hypothetical protein
MNNLKTKFQEKYSRSFAKVVSWRIIQTISHILNGLIVTGSLVIGLQIAGLAAVINSGLFWFHERAWNYVQWNRNPKDGLMFLDGQPRSISKIITWRILITASNFFIPLFMTGSWGKAGAFLGIATVVNMILFYFHERSWNRITWGKKVVTE